MYLVDPRISSDPHVSCLSETGSRCRCPLNTGAPLALYYMYSTWCELMQKLLVVGKCKPSFGEETTLRLTIVD